MSSPLKTPVSLQLWSLRDEMKSDFAQTVAAVAKIGYPAVELAGYGNLDVRGAKAALDAAGLKVSGMHIGPNDLQTNLPQVVSDALIMNTRYVVVAWWPGDQFISVAACQKIGEMLNAYGEKLRGFGLQLAFHNHAVEFTMIEGRPALEWVLSAAEPRNLQAEVDMFWVHQGGYSPAKFLYEQGRRIPLVHLKDQKELGHGPVDYPAVFSAAEPAGAVEWYIVEQEEYNFPPLECARMNFEQLRRWGLV